MPFKRRSIVAAGFAVAALGACALLPEGVKDRMGNSEKASLNLQMGVRYMDLGMLDIAKEKLELAESLDSSNPETQNALAVFYERIKDFEQADDHYKSALNKDPENIGTKNNYGRFLCEHGDHAKGVALLRESLDSPMNNRSWLALTNLGVCMLRQNDIERAEGYFRQALLLNAGYATALQEMQKISYNKQQFMSARAFLERYLAVAKHTPETLWIAVQTERSLGNSQGADEYKELLLTLFPASQEAQQVKSAINK